MLDLGDYMAKLSLERYNFINKIQQFCVDLNKSSSRYLAPHKLTEAQFNILLFLKDRQNQIVSQKQIVGNFGVTRANVSIILSRMQRQGLIKRLSIKNDKRLNKINLTPLGKRLIVSLEKKYFSYLQNLLSKITKSDCKHLDHILNKVEFIESN